MYCMLMIDCVIVYITFIKVESVKAQLEDAQLSMQGQAALLAEVRLCGA